MIKSKLVRHVLSNGSVLFIDEIPTLSMAALQAWVRVGSGDEDKRSEAGIAHVIEHMLFKGSERFPNGELSLMVEGLGGSINAWTSYDETVFHVVVPPDSFASVLDPFVDAIFNPLFDEQELTKEKEVILEEIRHGHDSPSHRTYDALFATAFKGYRYSEPIIGTNKSVSSFHSSDLRSFHGRYYVGDNVTFIVASPIPAKDVIALFEQRMGLMKGGRAPARNVPPYEPPPSRSRLEKGNFKEVYLSVAFPTEPFSPQTAAISDVLAVLLGEGETSRLVQRLQYEERLVLHTYAWNYLTPYAGLFLFSYVFTPDSNPERILEATREVLRDVMDHLHPSEVEKAKTIIESEEVESLQTAQGIAKRRGFMYFETGDPEADVQYIRAVRSVDAERVREYLHSLVGRGHRWYAAAALPSERDDLFPSGIFRKVAKPLAIHAPKRKGEPIVHEFGDGTTLVMLEDRSLPWVCMRAGWTGGLLTESDRIAGISHIMSDVLTRGTIHRDGERLNRDIEVRGGVLTGFSGRNSFGARVDILSHHWEEGLETLWEVLTVPAWDEKEVDRAKMRTLQLLQADEDNHSFQTTRLLERSLYGRRHPYGLPIHGTPETIASITRKRIQNHWRRWYASRPITLAVVGDVDPKLVIDKVEALLGQRPASSVQPPSLPLEFDARPVRKRAYKKRDISQNHIMVGALGVSLSSGERSELDVLASILGGMSGRLFSDLRDERSLAYHVTALSLEGLAPGYFAAYIVTRPEMAHEARDGLLEHLRRVRTEKVTRDELERAVNHLIGIHKNGLQRRSSVAANLLYSVMYGMGLEFFLGYEAMLRKVTQESIIDAAAKYLSEERLVTAVYGPREL